MYHVRLFRDTSEFSCGLQHYARCLVVDQTRDLFISFIVLRLKSMSPVYYLHISFLVRNTFYLGQNRRELLVVLYSSEDSDVGLMRERISTPHRRALLLWLLWVTVGSL